MYDDSGLWPKWFVKKMAGKNWNRLNKYEQNIAYIDPWGMYKMGQAEGIVKKWGMHYYGKAWDRDNIQANAFRHAFLSAVATFMIGGARTKKFTDAHEAEAIMNPNFVAGSKMDLFNNARGREIGELYAQKWSAFRSVCMSYGGSRISSPQKIIDYFYYFGVKISLGGDHYANLALMAQTAAGQGNGKVLKWIS